MACEHNQIMGLICTCREFSFYSRDSEKPLDNFEQEEAQICTIWKLLIATEVWISKGTSVG